jgi:S1-C subfamily serine protease
MPDTRALFAAVSEDLTEIVSRAARRVVAVNARDRIPSSGILWRPGIILAADHTVRRDTGITIRLSDGTSVGASIAGRDQTTDLVALRLDGGVSRDADAAPVGDASAVAVGNLVLVVGRPGRDPVATLGLVHAAGGTWRTWRGGSIDRAIRLDISIHDGFSGAALVNAAGHIVGLTTSGLGRGAAIAIPASTLDRVLDRLLTHGTISRGYLGIAVQGVRVPPAVARDSKLPRPTGAIVVAVEAESPAERSGILLGDVLLALDGQAISHAGDLLGLLGGAPSGTRMVARVLRAGEVRELPLVVGTRQSPTE